MAVTYVFYGGAWQAALWAGEQGVSVLDIVLWNRPEKLRGLNCEIREVYPANWTAEHLSSHHMVTLQETWTQIELIKAKRKK